MNGRDLDGWMRQELEAVEAALERWVPGDSPAGLGEAVQLALGAR